MVLPAAAMADKLQEISCGVVSVAPATKVQPAGKAPATRRFTGKVMVKVPLVESVAPRLFTFTLIDAGTPVVAVVLPVMAGCKSTAPELRLHAPVGLVAAAMKSLMMLLAWALSGNGDASPSKKVQVPWPLFIAPRGTKKP